MSYIVIITLVTILIAEFVNGWTDAPNSITTVIATKVMTPRQAVLMAVIFNILGAISGTAVAYTIGKGIVDLSFVTPKIIIIAMISLIVWSSVAAKFGIPTSESHALVAGITGAVFCVAGVDGLLSSGWIKVAYGLLASLLMGFGLGFIFAKVVKLFSPLLTNRKSKILYDRLQIFSSMFMSYNHGMNDGQKFIGMFSMALVVGGVLPSFSVPFWVIMLCSLVMGIGTSIGGWGIIKKTGTQMVSIKSWQGFSSQMGASSTILLASFYGIPLSTTHTINTAMIGSAGAVNMKKIRWSVATSIISVWFLTFPGCALIAYLITLITKFLNI